MDIVNKTIVDIDNEIDIHEGPYKSNLADKHAVAKEAVARAKARARARKEAKAVGT